MTDNKNLSSAVICLLRPLVRLLLANGIGFATFAEWVKQVYVAVAEDEFPTARGKQSGSRIATLTGLHRKEVARIRAELADESGQHKQIPIANRAQRVINAWLQEPLYKNAQGEPLVIAIKGKTPSFNSLVKLASGDIYPSAIMDELMMSGIVEYVDEDHIRMKQSGYIPDENNAEKLTILGQSGCDLLTTLEHNVNPNTDEAYLQMSVAYNHLTPDVLEAFKQLSRQEVTALLLRLNTWLAEHNGVDTNNNNTPNAHRAGLGIYYFQDQQDKQDKQ